MPNTNTEKALSNELSIFEQRLGPIEYHSVSALDRYEGNPRSHPEKQLVKLANSIREFGFAAPVLVDQKGTIIAGEARVEAAKRVGLKELPVIVARHWSAAQIKAYRLADNRLAEMSRWDKEALSIELASIVELDETPVEILGWETGELDLLFEELEKPATQSAADRADDQLPLVEEVVSESGDLWHLGRHRVLCGSSLERESWSRLLGGETAAMAFTDLPRNPQMCDLLRGLGHYEREVIANAPGETTRPEFTEITCQILSQMLAHVGEGAVLDLCVDWRHLRDLLAVTELTDLSLLDLCVWNTGPGDIGSLYRSSHEIVLVARKGKAPRANIVELARHRQNRTNVWDYPHADACGSADTDHRTEGPAIKPVALVADAIRDVTNPNDIVLDAFVGSGTTILAAERTERRAFGIETSPSLVDLAVRRWEQLTGQEAVLAATGQSFGTIAQDRVKRAQLGAAPALETFTQ